MRGYGRLLGTRDIVFKTYIVKASGMTISFCHSYSFIASHNLIALRKEAAWTQTHRISPFLASSAVQRHTNSSELQPCAGTP